jgi:hypothetical protein
MLSKLQKGMLVLTAVAVSALFAGSAGLADGPPTKSFKVSPGAISQFKPPSAARSPADLEASVFVMNNQNLSPWIVKGVIKNAGGHDFTGQRVVTLYRVVGNWGPGRVPRTVALTKITVTSLKAGQSVSLQKVFTVQPAAGTRFMLIISPGDVNPANDHAEVVFRGT